MHSRQRVLGAILAGVVIGSGAGGTAAAAAAPPATFVGSTESRLVLGVLDLPVLSGIPAVGSTLELTDPVWSLPGVSTSYQWLRDGLPIVGATGSSYVPVVADAGHQVTARVTGTLLGFLPLSVLTNAIDLPALPDGPGDPDAGALVPLDLPLLSGIPEVGSLLSLTTVVWSLPGVTTTVQWLSDGVPIPGATDDTFTPTLDLVGTQVSALVTGTLAGLPVVSVLTDALGVSLPGPDSVTASAAPGVTGSGKVGTTLTGSAPEWRTSGVTTTYQWLRNGVAIADATTLTYPVTADDVGKQLTLRADGTKGAGSGSATSAPVLGSLGDAPNATSAPRISGTARAGRVLTAQPGTWSGAPQPAFAYQWYAGGTAISGATGSTYVVRAVDAGTRLGLRVRATRPGHAVGQRSATPVRVARLASTTKVSLVAKRVREGARGLLRVTLRAASLKPAGKVRVYDGKRLLATHVVRRADNGTRTFTLPQLRPGRHVISARFAGDTTSTGSRSRPVVLTVTKNR